MNILGIDTSCDDTAAAVVVDGRQIGSSVVLSQQRFHAEHGGVVPEVASRLHLDQIGPVVERALSEAGLELRSIDAVGATVGPGLAGSLLVGYNFGRALALARHLPFVPVNHLEGHIYSAWLLPQTVNGGEARAPGTPLVILIVSGGHTELVLMMAHGQYRRLGGTRDDAAGEAFDKVGRLLGLMFPGGPAIESAAAALPSNTPPITMPRAWLKGTYDFSFSGLKTAALNLIRAGDPLIDGTRVSALAAGFQESVADVLASKTITAVHDFAAESVVLCGGVAANIAVREALRARLPPEVSLHVPIPALCTDNGAMIAAAAYYRLENATAPFGIDDVSPGLTLPTATAPG